MNSSRTSKLRVATFAARLAESFQCRPSSSISFVSLAPTCSGTWARQIVVARGEILGLVSRANLRHTQRSVAGHERATDLVQRDFHAQCPNQCWVADFTHVATWAGVVCMAFVVDVYSRAIVGWSADTSKQTKLVLDALDMAL
jgi:Integrase core domain